MCTSLTASHARIHHPPPPVDRQTPPSPDSVTRSHPSVSSNPEQSARNRAHRILYLDALFRRHARSRARGSEPSSARVVGVSGAGTSVLVVQATGSLSISINSSLQCAERLSHAPPWQPPQTRARPGRGVQESTGGPAGYARASSPELT